MHDHFNWMCVPKSEGSMFQSFVLCKAAFFEESKTKSNPFGQVMKSIEVYPSEYQSKKGWQKASPYKLLNGMRL